jgi:DNA (cytosine-5)-methyltransferase 1
VNAIDLFAGAGGLTLGLKQAGIHTVAAVEIDPYRVRTFLGHTRDAEVIQEDIRGFDFFRFRRDVALVYGGPPCQPFSSGGLLKAEQDERNMIPAFVTAVAVIRPDAFLMENVPRLAAGDRLIYLEGIIQQFERLDYSVKCMVLNAADYGVPQKRRRLFVVGMRGRSFRFPMPTHEPTPDEGWQAT